MKFKMPKKATKRVVAVLFSGLLCLSTGYAADFVFEVRVKLDRVPADITPAVRCEVLGAGNIKLGQGEKQGPKGAKQNAVYSIPVTLNAPYSQPDATRYRCVLVAKSNGGFEIPSLKPNRVPGAKAQASTSLTTTLSGKL